MGGGQMQTGNKQLVANNPQTPRYAMRAREPQVINSMAPAAEPGMRHTTSSSTSSSSPPGFQTSDFPSLSVGKFDFPSLGGNKSDFPSLGGNGKPVSESSEATNKKLLATPWARVVSSDKAVNNCDRVTPLPSTSSDIKEEKDREKVVVEIEEDNEDGEDEVTQVSEDLTLKQEEEEEEEVFEVVEKIEKVVDAKNIGTGEACELVSETEESRCEVKSSGIEVVKPEEEFNRRKADNSAPVVIFEDVDDDWQQQEEGISFGFDVNQDLVLHTGSAKEKEGEEGQFEEFQPRSQQAPLTPVDVMDSAILSFGGPESAGLRPLIVGVPVTGQEGLQLLYTHPQFQGMMAAPYAHHYP